jgi:periplasmic divalent cation tolerance protein
MTLLIYSTAEDIQQARNIAHVLIQEKLAACVNILPQVESIYRWKDKIEEDTECIVFAKTSDKNKEKIIQRIKQLHSYEVPDIICIPIVSGYKKYLEWVDEETV